MPSDEIKVIELFAGVGGFRLALDGYRSQDRPEFNMPKAGPFVTVWASQWEPPGTEGRQFAARCYTERFGEDANLINDDIAAVLDSVEAGEYELPDCDMVVGGFPCQDYSVAKPLPKAGGLQGKKGVLWWEIHRLLQMKRPRYVLLENVDRMLKSPASQRGRDYAIMLSTLAGLGYSVEWRVINAADYGFAQRRRRVFILGILTDEAWNLENRVRTGVITEAFPIAQDFKSSAEFELAADAYELTQHFGIGDKVSRFLNAGVMQGGRVFTAEVEPEYSGRRSTLGDVLVPSKEVPQEFYIDKDKLPAWRYQKGAKKEERTNAASGFEYTYSEGAMRFPDSVGSPSRTILTGEGGSGASRFKHVILRGNRFRRLVPDELDQLQGFPKGWTNTGMSDGNRAFCMGNALVVGIPHRIGKVLAKRRG